MLDIIFFSFSVECDISKSIDQKKKYTERKTVVDCVNARHIQILSFDLVEPKFV